MALVSPDRKFCQQYAKSTEVGNTSPRELQVVPSSIRTIELNYGPFEKPAGAIRATTERMTTAAKFFGYPQKTISRAVPYLFWGTEQGLKVGTVF
jgi:hypothetical protein